MQTWFLMDLFCWPFGFVFWGRYLDIDEFDWKRRKAEMLSIVSACFTIKADHLNRKASLAALPLEH